MIDADLALMDATAQAELVRNGELSGLEAVDAAIQRIEALNPVLNAVIHPMFEQAREIAKTPQPGAFSGVPFVLKDLAAECQGSPLSDGSRYGSGRYISPADSELVRRYKAAGLIIVGRTNSSEYGLLPATEPEHYGPTLNPWDIKRGTGGSSGGSAAAVATGMVPVGHASDGGGSIRIPSSCCGLVGLKPTRGRNTLGPGLGDIAGGIIHEHVVARSVRDSAAILDATAGPMPGDPYVPPAPHRPYVEEITEQAISAAGPLKIGLGILPLNGASAHPECIEAAQSTARLCEELGHVVEEASPTVDGRTLFKSFGQVMTGYLGWNITTWERRTGISPSEEDFEAVTWRMYQHSKTQTSAEYLLAWENLQKCCRQFSTFFSDYDLWLSPTLAQPPMPLGYFDYSHENRMEHIAHLGDFTGYTLVANATGQPAVSLPMYWTDNNTEGKLPIGVQFTAPYGDESLLFRIAAQLERARPWASHRPIIGFQ